MIWLQYQDGRKNDIKSSPEKMRPPSYTTKRMIYDWLKLFIDKSGPPRRKCGNKTQIVYQKAFKLSPSISFTMKLDIVGNYECFYCFRPRL